jgi:hypothetical protein
MNKWCFEVITTAMYNKASHSNFFLCPLILNGKYKSSSEYVCIFWNWILCHYFPSSSVYQTLNFVSFCIIKFLCSRIPGLDYVSDKYIMLLLLHARVLPISVEWFNFWTLNSFWLLLSKFRTVITLSSILITINEPVHKFSFFRKTKNLLTTASFHTVYEWKTGTENGWGRLRKRVATSFLKRPHPISIPVFHLGGGLS